MSDICDLARSYDLFVIEDCAQAHGARISDRPVGSFGDVAAWVFVKTRSLALAVKAVCSLSAPNYKDLIWSFKDHGKDFQSVFGREHPPGFRWLHERFGSNSSD